MALIPEFQQLKPASQVKLYQKHPELHNYSEAQQLQAIKPRLKRDREADQKRERENKPEKVAQKAAVKQEAVVKDAEEKASTVNVTMKPAKNLDKAPLDTTGWAAPTTVHHDTLDKLSSSIRNAADRAAAEGKSVSVVHAALDKADAHLEDHLAAHAPINGDAADTPVAAGHLEEAAKSIGEAARAFHIISPYKGGAEPVAKHAEGTAADYKAYVAGGKRAAVRYSPRASVDAYLKDDSNSNKRERSRTREAEAAENERAAAKKAAKQAEIERKNPSREELARRKAESDAAVSRSLASLPESTKAPRVGLGPKERAAARSAAEQKSQAWSVKGGSPVNLAGTVVPSAREYVKHHAKIALESLKEGQKIPSNSARVLGPAGVRAVNERHALNLEHEAAAEPNQSSNEGLFEGVVKPSRTGSFNKGRGA
jgi:hypothetical protein